MNGNELSHSYGQGQIQTLHFLITNEHSGRRTFENNCLGINKHPTIGNQILQFIRMKEFLQFPFA